MGHGLLEELAVAFVLGGRRRTLVRIHAGWNDRTGSSWTGLPRELLRGGRLCALEWRQTSTRRRMGSCRSARSFERDIAGDRTSASWPGTGQWAATGVRRCMGMDLERVYGISRLPACRGINWRIQRKVYV